MIARGVTHVIFVCPKCGRELTLSLDRDELMAGFDAYGIRANLFCEGVDHTKHLEVRMKETKDGMV